MFWDFGRRHRFSTPYPTALGTSWLTFSGGLTIRSSLPNQLGQYLCVFCLSLLLLRCWLSSEYLDKDFTKCQREFPNFRWYCWGSYYMENEVPKLLGLAYDRLGFLEISFPSENAARKPFFGCTPSSSQEASAVSPKFVGDCVVLMPSPSSCRRCVGMGLLRNHLTFGGVYLRRIVSYYCWGRMSCLAFTCIILCLVIEVR